jgi:hypothetical protein
MLGTVKRLFTNDKQVDNIGNRVVYSSKAPFDRTEMNKIVEEIHETFFTEVDRLLADAKILRSTHSDKEDLLERKSNLEKLGFGSAKPVVEGSDEFNRLRQIKSENEKREKLVNTIEYFSFKYPMYKFITEESVEMICKKYNLMYSEVSNYIGDVPDKNINDMLNFSIKDEDACYGSRGPYSSNFTNVGYDSTQREDESRLNSWNTRGYYTIKLPFEICAPLIDFKDDLVAKGHKLEKAPILDPIVLQPVYHNNKKHYLIVTAWGIEAEDPLVMNANLN